MATTFRTEDEAIEAEAGRWAFTGPHFHTEHERDAEGNLTGRTVQVWDVQGQFFYSEFATVQVPCSEGCWY